MYRISYRFLVPERSAKPLVSAHDRIMGYPETVRRRAGHILDEAVAALDMTGVACGSGPLASTLTARAAVTPLMPGVGRFFPPAHDGAEPLRVDERWRVRVNALLDPDT